MSSEIDIAQQNEENPLGDSLFAQLVESIQKSVVKKVNNPDQSSNDGKPNQDSESDDGEIKESDNESDLEKLGQAKKAKKRKKDHKKHKKKDHKRDKGEKKSKKSSDKSKSWYDLGEYEPNSKSKSYVSEENAVKPSHRRRSASVSSAGSTSKIRRSKSRERDDSSRKRAKLSPPEVPRSKLVVRERSEERDNRLYSEHRSVSQARSPPRRTSNRERDSRRSENSYYRSSYDPYYREPRSDNRWYYKDRKSSTRSVSTCSRRTRTPRSVAEKIDKAKLLAIARENLAKMIKEGTLPKGAPVDKFKLRHLKELSAADSVHQYAEFCRAISAMEAAAYSDSSLSGSDIDSDDEVRSVISQVTFDGRHPFALKERKDIQIKIRNLPQIQARSAKEVQSELRSEFPVSSGNMHKHKQLEWKEVEQPGPLALMPPPMAPPPKTKKTRTQEYPPPFAPPPEAEQPTTSGSTADSEVQPSKQTMDIGSIMAARISAMRVLEQDPQNAVALKQMEQANEMMTQWSTLQVMPGQFTGNTGVNLLTPDQLQGDRPAWTKGNEFRQAVALNGGIGKHLLLKMGWAEGTGLGRNNDGILEPIMPSLKLDTKGLKSEEEDKPTKSLPLQLATPPGIVAGSLPVIKHHPVAMLQEYCMKNKILIPEYIMVEESGPPHRPIFVMKVNVKNVWYQPTISASSKKIAKALAAAVACQAFNLLPKDCAI